MSSSVTIFGPPSSIDLVSRDGAVDGARHRLSNIADEDRLKPRHPVPDKRHHRHEARQRGETVEEIILRAKDHGWAQHHRAVDGERRCFARGLGALIRGRPLGIGPDRRDLDEASALDTGGLRHRPGARVLNRRESLTSLRREDADEVDDRIGAFRRFLDRPRKAQIGLHGHDLPDHPERLQEAREIGPAHGRAHAVAAPRQGLHHMPAEKARSAEDRDDLRAAPDCLIRHLLLSVPAAVTAHLIKAAARVQLQLAVREAASFALNSSFAISRHRPCRSPSRPPIARTLRTNALPSSRRVRSS